MPKGCRILTAATLLSAAAFFIASPDPASALSEIPPAEGEARPEVGDVTAPQAEPTQDDTQNAAEEPREDTDSDTLVEKVAPLIEKLTGDQNADVSYDLTALPEPAARMRELLIQASAAGDLKAVVALMNPGPEQTSIGLDISGKDLETALMDMSGDQNGMEILAIILDLLDTGYTHLGEGSADEMYVWPYFVRRDINALTSKEEVELLRIVTAGDYMGMREFGGYHFYRIGISPDGRWRFFLAGD